MSAAPTLSILTGTRKRPDALARLVKSVIVHTSDVDWELLIADANDRPGTVWFPHPRVIVVPERPRLWPAAGYNRLAREHARGEWVAWLNDDAEVTPRWALAMLSALADRKDAAGMGAFYFQDREFYGPDWMVHEWPAHLLYANFGCLRRDLFLDVGGFDERCKVYGMDNSISLRVQDRGLGILAVPGARLIHHRKMTPERQREQEESEQWRSQGVQVLIEDYGAKFPQLIASQGRWPWRPAIPFDEAQTEEPSVRGQTVRA